MKLTIIHAIRPNNPSQKTQSLLGLEVVLILRNPLSHTFTTEAIAGKRSHSRRFTHARAAHSMLKHTLTLTLTQTHK
jgi:hypothetical protein